MPTVLVVDALDISREYLQHLLAKAGYGVVAAANGMEALEKIFTLPPALVMADINLPKVDGLRLVRYIRQHPELQNLPVLLMSAAPRPGEREAALRSGANLFRGTPLSPDDVVGLSHLLINATAPPRRAGTLH